MISSEKRIADRYEAIRQWLTGKTITSICLTLGRSRTWFYYWWERWYHYGVAGLHGIQPPHASPHNRTSVEIEQAVLNIRQLLEKRPYTLSGAPAIKRELEALDFHDPPAIRTIESILQRYGLTVPKQRDILQPFIREYPQPKSQQSNQLHELDLVGPRYFKGDSTKYYYSVLNSSLTVGLTKIRFTSGFRRIAGQILALHSLIPHRNWFLHPLREIKLLQSR